MSRAFAESVVEGVNQLTLSVSQHTRRPHVVTFVNGLVVTAIARDAKARYGDRRS